MNDRPTSYWLDIWYRFKTQKLGLIGLAIVAFFVILALYAPIFASSRPIVVEYGSTWYFPLFRYYFSDIYFSKPLDLFFNLLGFAVFLFFTLSMLPKKWKFISGILVIKKLIFLVVVFGFLIHLSPEIDTSLNLEKQAEIQKIKNEQNNLTTPNRERDPLPNFYFDLKYLNDYSRLNLVVDHYLIIEHDKKINELIQEQTEKKESSYTPYTLLSIENVNTQEKKQNLEQQIAILGSTYFKSLKKEDELRQKISQDKNHPPALLEELKIVVKKNREYEEIQNKLQFIKDKEAWFSEQDKKINFILMPLVRSFHWEDDAGGNQMLNIKMPLLELTRINRKDLTAALIFGSRISLFVGITATLLSLLIGIPLGLSAGFYGGKVDLIISRIVEIWESLPAFFMLLFVVTMLEIKSVFFIIVVIAIFSWTTIYRYVRAETLRQRELLYVDACKALGFSNLRILFFHLLPNSIAPVIALLPFDIMGAITKEAGLAFLGLGEEKSCSWGVLMDEGRTAFPAESSLLWPPAIVLTTLLIGIAFIGNSLSYAMDPKAK